jgi:pimeloyl-ACP methyl ester carboxylesterase
MTKRKDQTPLLLKVIRWTYPKVETVFPFLAHRFFLTLFFTPLKYKAPEKEIKAASFAEKFRFKVAGKEVQGYAWGNSSKTVLVIHGWAGRATQFRRFIKPLMEAGYRVVGFDGPAHGMSEGKKTTIREFEEAIREIIKITGVPDAVIAHSFGGGAALFASMNGLPIRTLVNIASPTIGDEIINTYIHTIGASEKTFEFFTKEIQKRYGKPFTEFTALHAIQHLPQPINLLLVYDENDREVSMKHALALKEIYPAAELIRTKGLGHTRILKDNEVIRSVVTYIQRQASS